MIEAPARNLAVAHKELEAAKAAMASARTGAETQRAQAQLANAQTMVERATTAQAARQKQYDIMRNTVFRTGEAASAAEARLAAMPVAAGLEADRAARVARFRADVEVAATPTQVERLRAKAQADIEALN